MARGWLSAAGVAVLVMAGACRPAAPPENLQAPIEPVYRAIRKLQAAVDTGLSFQQLGQMVQDTQAELMMAKDRASKPEQQRTVALYAECLSAYQDSLKLWSGAIELRSDEIPLVPPFTELATRYGIMPEVKPLTGTQTFAAIAKDASLRAIWQKASERAEAAHAAFLALKPAA